MTNSKLTKDDVIHVAKLANLSLSELELEQFRTQLANIFDLIDQMQKLPTENEPMTSQVTGLENIFREDEIDVTRQLTQEEALKNANKTKNGYFIVSKIL